VLERQLVQEVMLDVDYTPSLDDIYEYLSLKDEVVMEEPARYKF
jgi:hypothetical protein